MSTVANIDSQQLQEWLASGEAILVDVREPEEFASFRIPQAMSMPLSTLETCLSHIGSEKRKVVFQCLKGVRGQKAAQQAKNQYPELCIFNLDGGIEAWEMVGLDVIGGGAKAEEEGISIARQVHIVVGGLVAFTSLVALLDFPIGAFLSFIIGGGLLYSGALGTCGIAQILQKMPWNKDKS